MWMLHSHVRRCQSGDRNAWWQSPSPSPIGARSILVRDSDGRFIELRQLATPPAGTTGILDIMDMRLSITVNDMEETMKVYRNVLGFTAEGETRFTADAAMRSLTGLSKAEVRRSRVQAPGSQLWIEFVEFKGVDRTPLRMKIQDRGAARLQLRVQDTDAIVAVMKAAGFKVMSTGGAVQPIPPNFKAASPTRITSSSRPSPPATVAPPASVYRLGQIRRPWARVARAAV